MGACLCQPLNCSYEIQSIPLPKPIEMVGVQDEDSSSEKELHAPQNITPLHLVRGCASVKIVPSKFINSFVGSIHNYYNIEAEIGCGSYGKIYRARHIATRNPRAIKVISRQQLKAPNTIQLNNEAEILKSLDHPNILKIYEVIEDASAINIVTELCTGGNLFERILKNDRISENTAAQYIRQIVSSLIYCHNHSIVHRDLKPENILFETKDKDSPLKVIDFGIATKIVQDIPLNHFIGTVIPS